MELKKKPFEDDPMDLNKKPIEEDPMHLKKSPSRFRNETEESDLPDRKFNKKDESDLPTKGKTNKGGRKTTDGSEMYNP